MDTTRNELAALKALKLLGGSGATTPKLAEFAALAGGDRTARIAQNERLFEWLCDDDKRAALYAELAIADFPTLRFKSVVGPTSDPAWPHTDVFLVSKPRDIDTALKEGSVAPYQALESGGRFMLALDNVGKHTAQREAAAAAMRTDNADDIDKLIAEAVRRAAVLPFKRDTFDLPLAFAEEAALRFAELYFGISHLGHGDLKFLMRAVYTKLTFQIVGRHFVADSGLPPSNSPAAEELVARTRQWIVDARKPDERELAERTRLGLPAESVIRRMGRQGGVFADESLLVDVVLGLIAGTIGNVTAAASIAIAEFFTPPVRQGDPWKIDAARRAAFGDDKASHDALAELIDATHALHPPAPFLARVCCTRDGPQRLPLKYVEADGRVADIPHGALLLLALGADRKGTHVFGGGGYPDFMHQCIGRWLARPLVHAVVREVLRLPGLRPALDAETEAPVRLQKRWGAACVSYRMEYQRDRRLVQQPLILKIPIKEPVAENAAKLDALTRGGAWIVDDALDGARHVHFAWFMLLEGGTHLGMVTAYDGDFDAYVEHFATAVDLFDEQLQYLEGAPPPPVRKDPKAFVEWIRKHNHRPLGDYFYSAYPRVTASQVHNAFAPPEEGEP